MLERSLLFWKLSGLCVITIVVAIAAMGYVGSLRDERDAISTARDTCRASTTTIRQALERLMMSRDSRAIRDMIADLTGGGSSYRDLRLVSHEGDVAASGDGRAHTPLPPGSESCRVCHDLEDPVAGAMTPSHERVTEQSDGGRFLSVLVPILNDDSCRNASCHAHADSGPVLGFLEADFSLSRVDARISERRIHAIIAILAAILFCTIATWFTMNRLVDRPIRALIAGMNRVAAGDLTFRFETRRTDEIGLLTKAFDRMTGELGTSLARLIETKEHLQGIVESSADIIITVSPDDVIQTFNRGAENVLGYSRDEVIGQRIEMLFADPRERDTAIARLADNDHVVNYSTHFVSRSGEVRDVLLTLSRLRDADGMAIGTFGISKDVTKERRLQRELIQAERLAAVGQALIGIQHSMKNMLNALSGGSYMVRAGLAKDDRGLLEEGWRMVDDEISSMTGLSANMLRYVRDWSPRLAKTEVKRILEKVQRVAGRTASDDGIRMRLDAEEPLPLVRCDPELIHSAVLDIVTNAIGACREKSYREDEEPEILIRAGSNVGSGRLHIVVRDNGCGMTDRVKTNIFTPFFSTKRGTGTGLGLAVVARIVRAHGGTIEVVSVPDRGSTFVVGLPIRGPNQGKEKRDAEEGAHHRR